MSLAGKEGGWGLVLVDRMADRWGIKHRADGKPGVARSGPLARFLRVID
jgi:hypothetical protein